MMLAAGPPGRSLVRSSGHTSNSTSSRFHPLRVSTRGPGAAGMSATLLHRRLGTTAFSPGHGVVKILVTGRDSHKQRIPAESLQNEITTPRTLALVCVLGVAFLGTLQLHRGIRSVSEGMGMVFGKIDVEQPAFSVDVKHQDYQIRKYAISC
jgi:hypothetical protein